MKRGRTCQRQNANLCAIAEKAAKAMQKAASAPFATQHNPP